MTNLNHEKKRLQRKIKKLRRRAESLRLATLAKQKLYYEFDPETAALLAIRALNTTYTFEADDALADAVCLLRTKRIFTGHTDHVWCAAFSPDGKFIVSGSKDTTLRLWDI